MAEVAILKTVKSPYLSNRLTDFNEIWHADADWLPTVDRSLKFSIFPKNKMAVVVIFKTHTNPDITTRNWQIFAKFGLIFENSRWRQPPSWKSRKSRYLRSGLTDLYEIWYADAKRVSKTLRPLKISNFTNPRWRTAAILKTVKSPYVCNRLTDFDEIWHGNAGG